MNKANKMMLRTAINILAFLGIGGAFTAIPLTQNHHFCRSSTRLLLSSGDSQILTTILTEVRGTNKRLDKLEKRVENVENKVEGNTQKMKNMENKMETMENDVKILVRRTGYLVEENIIDQFPELGTQCEIGSVENLLSALAVPRLEAAQVAQKLINHVYG